MACAKDCVSGRLTRPGTGPFFGGKTCLVRKTLAENMGLSPSSPRLGWPAIAGVLLAVCLVGCGSIESNAPSDDHLSVFVGVPPMAYLVEQIGAHHVEVDVLVRPGQGPHTFEPTPQQILALGRAKMFFTVDLPMETVLLHKVREGNRRLQVVDVTRGINKRPADALCCEHPGHDDHHRVAEPHKSDPHVWLSPRLLALEAETIAEALSQADPTHQQEYKRNLAALLDRLDAADRRVRGMLAPYRGRSFYVFHPGFGYFADAYGLKQDAVEVGGRAPTPKQLRALIDKARADGVTTVFVQPQFDPRSARVVAEALGGHVVSIDGLGKDVVANIEDIATRIQAAMKDSLPGRHREREGK